jgi:hypothetical protein
MYPTHTRLMVHSLSVWQAAAARSSRAAVVGLARRSSSAHSTQYLLPGSSNQHAYLLQYRHHLLHPKRRFRTTLARPDIHLSWRSKTIFKSTTSLLNKEQLSYILLHNNNNNNNTPRIQTASSTTLSRLRQQTQHDTTTIQKNVALVGVAPPEEIRSLWLTLVLASQHVVVPRMMLGESKRRDLEQESALSSSSSLTLLEQGRNRDESRMPFVARTLGMPSATTTTDQFQAATYENAENDEEQQQQQQQQGVILPADLGASSSSHEQNAIDTVLPTETKIVPSPEADRYGKSISNMLNQRYPERALSILNEAVKKGFGEELSKPMIRTLFFDLTWKRPVEAFQVLRIYQRFTMEEYRHDVNAYKDEYVRLCDSFRYLDPRNTFRAAIHDIVNATVQDLKKLDRSGQEKCFPVLASALAQQKTVTLGSLARRAYQYVVDQQFVLKPGYWEHMLSHSRYFRQKDLPYDEILEKAVAIGRRPNPNVTLCALGNLFPYDDTQATFRMLKAIWELQSTAKPGEKHYRVDISTLELIGAAAADKQCQDMNLVIWDLADALGYEPTEFMYENAILALCAQHSTYTNAFAVLSDMEERGMQPSRALIRCMSTYLRYVFVDVLLLF